MTDSLSDFARARRAFIWWALIVPLALTVVAVVVQVLAIPALPDPVAVHWGASGEPDGFAAPWVAPVMSAAVGVGLTALLGVFAYAGAREGEWGPTLRFLGAMTPAAVAGVLMLATWSVLGQRGLASGTDAPNIVPAVVAAAVTALVVGLVGWFAQPAVTVSGGNAALSDDGTLAPLAPTERVVWLRSVTMSTPGMLALYALVALMLGGAMVSFLTSGSASVILLIVGLILGALVAATTMFRVRIDDQGLRVTSYLGIPRFRIPLGEVSAVHAVFVSPLADFGG
ncbi:DUF1648 domain-containing protein [Microbacterium schleiferi]|uniref:DUF1648 domain-containing protein n=1 Tax=Microbacterium schleiferi TaxID=69362 RepID=A0ABU7V899_9MICO|nr:DUF1648 domain-containing protein [Micrococcales bacterium]